MASKKKKTHSINNKEFEQTILNYQRDPEQFEEEIFKMFDLLISSIIHSFKFKVDFDDAKQECFLLILKILPNFSPEKGKAFNYFTTSILNHLKLQYTKNKRYQEKLHEYRDIKGENKTPEGFIKPLE